ncbi:hypothetical protein SCHPADRAFT_570025 [Schizopora paradoxa]|uniref:Uncharacterized protein n=1 Tax=Schizopora paradoxa TaxID=27342 RepID=A0A0H2RIV4_9AGAM|nr:hypothetical protein SCHPADRAFT_570025 [Schizopora paradoxa]
MPHRLAQLRRRCGATRPRARGASALSCAFGGGALLIPQDHSRPVLRTFVGCFIARWIAQCARPNSSLSSTAALTYTVSTNTHGPQIVRETHVRDLHSYLYLQPFDSSTPYLSSLATQILFGELRSNSDIPPHLPLRHSDRRGEEKRG